MSLRMIFTKGIFIKNWPLAFFNLNSSLAVDENVSRLEIPMHDSLRVDVIDTGQNLPED